MCLNEGRVSKQLPLMGRKRGSRFFRGSFSLKMCELVSVIMTTYNSISVIRNTLESVVSQDYPNIEIIAADGGSTDGTAEVLGEYEQRLKTDPHCSLKWVSEKDRGIYDAMNKALRMSSGTVIGICNDQFTGTDALSKLVTALRSGDYLGVHSDLIYADAGRCVRYWHMGPGKYCSPQSGGGRGSGYTSVFFGWMPAHPTLYLDRKVYEAYGEYALEYRSSSDYEFMLRFLRPADRQKTAGGPVQGEGASLPAVRLAYVPEVLISMYYGGTSNGGFHGYLRNAGEAARALKSNHVRFAGLVIVMRIIRTLCQFFRPEERYRRSIGQE